MSDDDNEATEMVEAYGQRPETAPLALHTTAYLASNLQTFFSNLS